MPQSAIDTRCLSMLPHEAFGLVSSPASMFFTDSQDMVNYVGRVVIHSTNYPGADAAKEGYGFLEEAGWSKEDAPQASFLGYCRIKSGTTKLCTEEVFQSSRGLHRMPDVSLKAMLRRLGWQKAWALTLQDPHWAIDPVSGIKPDQLKPELDFWLPDQPYLYEGIKMVTNKKRSLPFQEALDVVYPEDN